jgi:hypothetical protein
VPPGIINQTNRKSVLMVEPTRNSRGLTADGPKQGNDDGPAGDACCVLPNIQPLGIMGVPLHIATHPATMIAVAQTCRRLASYWSSMLNRTKGNISHTLRKRSVVEMTGFLSDLWTRG